MGTRIYQICYEINGKCTFCYWQDTTIASLRKRVEKFCKEFDVSNFQFIFRKRIYTYSLGKWFIEYLRKN